jgi:hypothetical protein
MKTKVVIVKIAVDIIVKISIFILKKTKRQRVHLCYLKSERYFTRTLASARLRSLPPLLCVATLHYRDRGAEARVTRGRGSKDI